MSNTLPSAINVRGVDGSNGEVGSTPGTPNQAPAGAKATSHQDSKNRWVCDTPAGPGNPGLSGNTGSIGGEPTDGLAQPSVVLRLGKLSGNLVINVGGGNGGKGGKGGRGTTGGQGGPPGDNANGCTANTTYGAGGKGGKGGNGHPGGKGGDGTTVILYYTNDGGSWSFFNAGGAPGLGGDPGDPGPAYPGSGNYPAGSGDLGQGNRGPNGTYTGAPGSVAYMGPDD